jgi:pimeloyl-ACP methyl ester carboxylesterase
MDSFKKDFDNHNTYYEQGINTNNIPTIFIHGVGLDNTMWYPQKKIFENKTVIFYDILNHGKSEKGHKVLSFDDFNHQLNNLLNYLKINKINLIGFSIGALIAQHFTLEHKNKINKLVLIGSVYNRSKEQIKIIKNRYEESRGGASITEESINRWFSKSYLKENPDVYSFFFNLLESKKNEDFMPAYKVFVESDKNKIDLSKFNMPTLIMTGENEIGSTPKMSEELNKYINNSILYIIKDAKHGATIEKADDVNEQLVKFLFS